MSDRRAHRSTLAGGSLTLTKRIPYRTSPTAPCSRACRTTSACGARARVWRNGHGRDGARPSAPCSGRAGRSGGFPSAQSAGRAWVRRTGRARLRFPERAGGRSGLASLVPSRTGGSLSGVCPCRSPGDERTSRSQCMEPSGREPACLGASTRAELSRRPPLHRNPASREAPSLRPGGARSMSRGVPSRDQSSRARPMVVPTPMAGERHRPKSSRIRASRPAAATRFTLAAGPQSAAKRRDTMQDAPADALGSRGREDGPRPHSVRVCASALAAASGVAVRRVPVRGAVWGVGLRRRHGARRESRGIRERPACIRSSTRARSR